MPKALSTAEARDMESCMEAVKLLDPPVALLMSHQSDTWGSGSENAVVKLWNRQSRAGLAPAPVPNDKWSYQRSEKAQEVLSALLS